MRRRLVRAAVLASLLIAVSREATADPVPAAVLDAERQRIDTIRRALPAAVSIFAGAAGGGSGVLISADGYALTNYHVVQPAGIAMKCGLSDGRLYDGVLVGLDPTGDVALVKLLGRDDFPHADLADSDGVMVGDFCFAAGNPFLLATDLQPSVSVGIVSGVHRYQFPAGTILEYTDCLQVDAAINPGNSGGGLFDAAGRLIGVNGRASFEKRGRVNVGVGYAISANQLRNFLGFLRGGRLVDHATLGATVAMSADGRVVVADILERADAFRRGLRYDDEILALAGRPVRTVNAFKNILGTLPAGWQVPLAYRRSGRRYETLVRLASVHTPVQLARLVAPEERDERPPESDESKPEDVAALPETVRNLYAARAGFTNYHFNVRERDRVAGMIAARAASARSSGAWVIAGHLDDGAPFRITLSDAKGTIELPTGTTHVDAGDDLDATPNPPGSGGLLPALSIWRRLIREGPAAVGRTEYWGTAPLHAHPGSPDATAPPRAAPAAAVLFDALVTSVAAVEARFAIDAHGDVVAIDFWSEPDADACEVRFSGSLPDAAFPGLPATMEVWRGNDRFGIFTIESVTLEGESS